MDATSQPTHVARRRTTTGHSATDLLCSGGLTSLSRPPPAAHIGRPPSPSTPQTFSRPSPRPMPTHSRSLSLAEVARQGKRLSLNFPIQPAAGSSSPRAQSRPVSWVSSPATSPEIPPSPPEGNFFTVLAAQERRVLELKEELQKAENDLAELKKQWTTNENTKKRGDGRRLQPLQPLNTTLANLPFTPLPDDIDGSSIWMQKEMERRRALLSATKPSHRKVFSGSRHTRTLSLLSPDRTTHTPSFPQPSDLRHSEELPSHKPMVSRTNTVSSVSSQSPVDLGTLQRTGKQMAADFKDSLFNFIEDLRQATVGDEAVYGYQGANPPGPLRRQSSRTSARESRKQNGLRRTSANSSRKSTPHPVTDDLIDIGGSFWKENGVEAASGSSHASSSQRHDERSNEAVTPPNKSTKVTDEFEESWDNWESSSEKVQGTESSSAEDSDGRTSLSVRSSPRTSTSSAGVPDSLNHRKSKRDSLLWPDIVKEFSPSNLKRTASHLMTEWEKSLTPPPESRQASFADPDYIGRSATPFKSD